MGSRQEQWEEIRNNKMRSESICKAEEMGKEMGNEIKNGMQKDGLEERKMEEPTGGE